VTTDGFITNLPDLETKLFNLKPECTPLLTLFKDLRKDLSEDPSTNTALELKNSVEGKGIISWSTRGQFGMSGSIKATTGFQSGGYTFEELSTIFKDVLSTEEKSFEYIQHTLRSAKDILKNGGHVTSLYKDKKVRLLYDNRRQILEPKGFDCTDMSQNFLDSKPFQSILECYRQRFISRFAFKTPFLKVNPIRSQTRSVYRSYIEIGVRNFIKGYLATQPCFGLKGDEFKSYRELIDFIYGFTQTKSIKLSRQSITNLKQRKTILRPVPKTRENLALVEYFRTKLPHFDEKSFLKL
jgi:hypothetical protein